MPETPLSKLDGGELQAHLSVLQSRLNELSNLYQKEIQNLSAIQKERMDAQREEGTVKNDMKLIREKMSSTKEEIRSVKVLIKAESN